MFRSPWLWVIAPFVAAVFPHLIPLIVILAIWQWTDGGERVGPAFEGWRRDRDPDAELREVRSMPRGPLPVGATPYDEPFVIPEEEMR